MKIKEIASFNPKGKKPNDYINYVDTSSVEDGKLIGLQTLSKDIPSRAQRVIEKNDILISSVRPILKHNFFVGQSIQHGVASTGFIQIRVNNSNVLPRFLYYYLTVETKVHQYQTIAETSQSTFPSFNKDVIEEMEFPNISLETQQHIVDILGTLDEKIENNSKILNELNNLIQLEFEKTILANSSEERLLADVFAFQEGPGIRNWQYVDKGINFINIRCINDGDIDTSSMNKISEQEAYGIYNHFLLNEWDLVMSMSGTLGRYAIVGKEHLPLCLNTSVIRFYPKNDFTYYSYMYAYLTSKDFIASITTLANGSAQQNVGPTHLKKVTIKLPNEEVIKQFHQRVFPLINRMVSLRGDNQKIKELKEYYLKKFFG